MDLDGAIEGVGMILRDKVDGWATTQNGTPHVYPDHPPTDLAKSSYPRATVDTIGYNPTNKDIEVDVLVGDIILDITTYGVNSLEVNSLLADSAKAVKNHHDDIDSNGDPYLEGFKFQRFGPPGPIIDEETEPGFTRYNKTLQVEFETITF